MQYFSQLNAIVTEAKTRPAVVVGGEDAGAYSKKALKELYQTYTCPVVKSRIRDRIQGSLQPSNFITLIANTNLDYLLEKVTQTVREATKDDAPNKLDDATVETIISEAIKYCTQSNVALTHDPHWQNSNHGKEDTYLAILKKKKLLSPAKLHGDSSESGFICCSPSTKAPEQSHFVIKPVPEELLKKSVVLISGGDGGLALYGGNDLEAAWQLNTICYAILQAQHDKATPGKTLNITNITKEAASNAFAYCEVKTPNEISLVGHKWIDETGAETVITGRETAKRAPVEPASIAPGAVGERTGGYKGR